MSENDSIDTVTTALIEYAVGNDVVSVHNTGKVDRVRDIISAAYTAGFTSGRGQGINAGLADVAQREASAVERERERIVAVLRDSTDPLTAATLIKAAGLVAESEFLVHVTGEWSAAVMVRAESARVAGGMVEGMDSTALTRALTEHYSSTETAMRTAIGGHTRTIADVTPV